VSLLRSVCMSWWPCFSVVGLAPSVRLARAEEREACDARRYLLLNGVIKCLRRMLRYALLKGEDTV
jgi:hypothetical protein